mgnify:CR=1 FL=1
MTFSPYKFYELAERLLNQEWCEEACYRTAVSRAYYATFNRAMQFIKNKDPHLIDRLQGKYKTDQKGIHFIVRVALRKLGCKAYQKMAELANSRIEADYRLDLHFKREKAEWMLEVARDILGMIERC